MGLIKKIKENVMPTLGVGVAIGLSAWSLTSAGVKSDSVQPATYIYHLNEDGTIGALATNNPSECSQTSGKYCSLVLSAPKPDGMDTVDEAETSSIYIRTNFKN